MMTANVKDMRIVSRMDDLISRQAAISAVNTMFAPTPTQADMVEDCVEIIENLPSVQPVAKDTNVLTNDTISRQAAIDGVKTLHDVAWKNWHEPTLSANVVLDMIRKLPSVQPEYTELKRELINMASYIDSLLECSDEQKETLIGFVQRMSECMPWTDKD